MMSEKLPYETWEEWTRREKLAYRRWQARVQFTFDVVYCLAYLFAGVSMMAFHSSSFSVWTDVMVAVIFAVMSQLYVIRIERYLTEWHT